MSLKDVSSDGLKELALYLKRFPSDDDDADQYWYQLACILRKRSGNTYRYSEQFLVEVGKAEDKAALVFLQDLCKRGIQLDDFIHCLEKINCQQAVRFFQPGATTPEIRPLQIEDQHKIWRAGETLKLSVEASCSPGPLHYVWFHNQKPLPGNNSPHLIIQDLTTAHAGTYHCKVTNPSILSPQSASALSPLVEVEVKEEDLTIVRQETSGFPGHVIPPPVILRQPTSVQVDRGHSVTLHCLAEQCLAYDWYKDGVRLKTVSPDGRLVLSHVTCADAGVYHCEVVNDGGKEVSSKAMLTVASDIKLRDQPPKCQTVRVGEKLRLHCSATSSTGKLSYQWFLLDKTMDMVKELRSLSKEQTFVPTVTSSNLTSKGRLYFHCKVTDMTDPANFVYTHIAEVRVQRVWIVEQPSDLHAVIKQRVQLSCTGEGDGELKYIWLQSATRDGRFEILHHHEPSSSGVLVFESLSNVDAGYYQCQVECGLQHVDSEVVQVKALLSHAVQAKTEPVIKILRQPRSPVVDEGAPFRLLFEAVCSTSHPLQYQWFFKGSKLSGATSNVYTCQSTSVDNCGSYWCSVKVGEGLALTLSKAARVELKYQETQRQGGTWEQREGERLFRTVHEERFAREKIALLIGNSDYSSSELSRLATPEHDVAALKEVLTALNFKVFSLLDLTHMEMQAALEMFYSLLQKVPGIYALFYFSGHGFSTSNQVNFLVPVNSSPEPSQCFQVSTIARRMQDTFSRAILILDACKVLKERVRPDDGMSYSSMGNTSNMFELWSCVDSMAASDASIDQWGPHPRSLFNKALTEIIHRDKCSLTQIYEHLNEELRRSGSQRPVSRQGMSDPKISLQDSIMMDDQDLESSLDQVLKEYCSAHAVPEAVRFGGARMKDLSGFAELELSFSLLLTNMLHIGAELVQVHEDKTSKASVQFDTEFVESQGVQCSQEDPLINGQEEGLCARASLVVRGLQRLRHPLKLILKVCHWESGQEIESSADITYEFDKMPLIATNCS